MSTGNCFLDKRHAIHFWVHSEYLCTRTTPADIRLTGATDMYRLACGIVMFEVVLMPNMHQDISNHHAAWTVVIDFRKLYYVTDMWRYSHLIFKTGIPILGNTFFFSSRGPRRSKYYWFPYHLRVLIFRDIVVYVSLIPPVSGGTTKDQWCWALILYLPWAWLSCWTNNRVGMIWDTMTLTWHCNGMMLPLSCVQFLS